MKMAMSEGSMTMTGRRCGSPLGGVEGDDLSLVYYYTIFPNLFLSLHPDYVLIPPRRSHRLRSHPHRLRVVLPSRRYRQRRLRSGSGCGVLGHDQS